MGGCKMNVDENVIKFGEEHLEAILMLDTIAGGAGFFGHPTRREIADSFALGEQWLLDNSPMYTNPLTMQIREKAEAEQDVNDLRKEFADSINPIEKTNQLIAVASQIQSPYQRQVRVDQAISLATVANIMLTDMNLIEEGPVSIAYDKALMQITGISPPLIPTEDYMQSQRREVLARMGVPESTPLIEAAAQWRQQVGLLNKDEMGATYEQAAKLILGILKSSKLTRNGFPTDAKLHTYTLEDAPFMGFFAYGDRQAGKVYGETCMVKSGTKCVFDVVATAAHEIGGHYLLSVLAHQYAKKTGDLFGAVGAMVCNEAVLQEGFANTTAEIFTKTGDLQEIFPKLDLPAEKMPLRKLENNLAISLALEKLAMVSLGYEAARQFHYQNVTPEQMTQEFMEYGVDPHRAESRTKHLTGAKTRLPAFGYFGPGYYPGMTVLGKTLENFGEEYTIRSVCNPNLGPVSISVLNSRIKR
jgi:hypothetical protein